MAFRNMTSALLLKAFVRVAAATAALATAAAPVEAGPVNLVTSRVRTSAAFPGARVTVTGRTEYHVTGTAPPRPGGGAQIDLIGPDAWLILDRVRPSLAATAPFLGHVRVGGALAVLGRNVRVVEYGSGSVVIPQPPEFAALTAYTGRFCAGGARPVRCFEPQDTAAPWPIGTSVRSFRLKRGYMATIAQQPNGTGYSQNFVAQDGDLEVDWLPPQFDRAIRFIRVFPWRWTAKKGVAGGIWQNLNVAWYYDWNIGQASTPDLEYVPIRQKRWWPPLDQDWQARGATTLLGYNEPDHTDQSNLTVADAISSWPDLLATGLRLGSPAVSDGGLNWLYDFIDKADAAHLRVDFVAVHYYRAPGNPADPKGATDQFYAFLKGIHDRTHRPIWVTEFNNGANWTGHRPTYDQEQATIAGFVDMLDRTPFVERYAIYNWVEDVRNVQRDDGSLTPAGQAYRDDVAPLAYHQALP